MKEYHLTYGQAVWNASKGGAAIRREHWCAPIVLFAGDRLWFDDEGEREPWNPTDEDRAATDWMLAPRPSATLLSEKPLNPWEPTTDRHQLRVLGKLGEELAEAGAATARCIIQGIDESEPVTGKSNREWLEDELADVRACALIAADHFGLDEQRMDDRVDRKVAHLRAWEDLMTASDPEDAQPPQDGTVDTMTPMGAIAVGGSALVRAFLHARPAQDHMANEDLLRAFSAYAVDQLKAKASVVTTVDFGKGAMQGFRRTEQLPDGTVVDVTTLDD